MSYRKIRKIGLGNFLGYGQYQELETGDVNIFIGKNSSGKSSILHALALLGETLGDTSEDTSLLLSGNGLNLGVYSDVVFKGRRSSSINMLLQFERESDQVSFSKKINVRADDRPNEISLTFREDRQSARAFLSAMTVYSPSGRCFTLQGGAGSRSVGYHGGIVRGYESKPTGVLPRFSHFLPTFRVAPTVNLRSGAPYWTVNAWADEVRETLANMVYLGPSRAPLSTLYVATGAYPNKLDSSAANLVPLAARSLRRKRDRRKLDQLLQEWLGKRFGLVSRAGVRSFLEGHAFRLAGRDPQIGADVVLSNTGYGVSQVLPLVALLGLSQPGIVLIEQPELHLHPAAQAELADLIIEYGVRGYQVFVETHSEHLLLRLRSRISESTKRRAMPRICVFIVEKRRGVGSIATSLELDETGKIANWPRGFFDVSSADIAALVRSGGL
jgi:predicted ATPase